MVSNHPHILHITFRPEWDLAEPIKLTAEVDVQWASIPDTYPELVPFPAKEERDE